MNLASVCLSARVLRTIALALTGLVTALLGLGLLAAPSFASQNQVSILQDDPLLQSDPSGTMLSARQLGASVVRVMLRWQDVAPNTNSFKAPRHFNATDPGQYPQNLWAPYDAIVRAAVANGITVDLDLLGGSPLWATGPGMPRAPRSQGWPFHNWRPSAAAYGQFVRAAATRYSGNWNPTTRRLDPGNPADLPRVHFWSIYNEPDYGPSLAPQALPGTDNVPYAADLYRGLVDQAWSALHATGHGGDTIVWGELAPRGTITYGNFNGMTPMVFLRGLYCVDAGYHPLRGRAASQLGCPTNPGGTAAFAAHNPALFHASGVSDHPYMRWYAPNNESPRYQPAHFPQLLPNYTTLATIGHLEGGLNRLVGVYRSGTRFPIYNTEFGYITSPPKRIWKGNHYPYVNQTTAAYYDNWAEYMSFKDSRIASFDQYLLRDAEPATPKYNYGGYASGLLNYNGTPKPGYAAFRMPLYMPRTLAKNPNQSLEVWGAVKPARFVGIDQPGTPLTATLMFESAGSSSFTTLGTVTLSPAGYFDTHLTFPSSGKLIVQWTYPNDSLLGNAGQTITSRTVQVTVK